MRRDPAGWLAFKKKRSRYLLKPTDRCLLELLVDLLVPRVGTAILRSGLPSTRGNLGARVALRGVHCRPPAADVVTAYARATATEIREKPLWSEFRGLGQWAVPWALEPVRR